MTNNLAAVQAPSFELGRLLITPGAQDAIRDAGQTPLEFLARHSAGDWGDLSDEDKRENEFSLTRSLRILSAYHTAQGARALDHHRSRPERHNDPAAGRILKALNHSRAHPLSHKARGHRGCGERPPLHCWG